MFESFGWHMPKEIYDIEVRDADLSMSIMMVVRGTHVRQLTSLISLSPLSISIVVVCTVVLLLGVKESAMINNVMTVINISIILFVIILIMNKFLCW